jgi:hypothetical protein
MVTELPWLQYDEKILRFGSFSPYYMEAFSAQTPIGWFPRYDSKAKPAI